MIFIELKDLETVNSFCKICDRYHDKMDIDVKYGRYIIDGCSVLAVTSLTGKTVKVIPNTGDALLKEYFFKNIEEIGAYKVGKTNA